MSQNPSRRTLLDFIIQQPLGSIGFIMIIVMFIAAIFAPEVAPYHPEDVDFEASPALGGRVDDETEFISFLYNAIG